ncbi:MAG: insulinase family protein [Ignavibacteriaceae bacterium]|nr:insulinase family protein [Ignavibacteriaceae bacterium]
MNIYNKTILPNGIKILSETIPYVKSFSLGFWFNVGSRDENSNNNGISHFIEHMLFKGTDKRTARRIADEIESCGGYLNAFTSKEHTCFYGRGLSEHLPKTFDVLADMIQNATFKPADLKKEAGVVVDELFDIEDNPEELIFDKFEEIIYSGNSLSMPIIGTEKNVKSFSQSDLFSFTKEKYTANRLIIAASGSVNHELIVKLTEKYLLKDFGASGLKRKYISSNNLPAQLKVIEKEIQQVHAILGRTTYGSKEDKRDEAAVLTQLLGEGSSSRLFQAVRERNGIAYQVNSFLNSFYDVSSFGVYLSTNEKTMDKALAIIKKEFKKLREKRISERELKKAKESLKGSFILHLESTTNRMMRMAQSELYFNRVKHTDEIVKGIDAVTVDDILKISNELLDEQSFIKLIIKSKDVLINSTA